MVKYLTLIICILIASCSVDNPSQSNYTETQTGAYGVTLLPSTDMWVTFDEVVSIYESTMTCLGMTAVGPDVIFTSATEYYATGYNAWGYYHYGAQLVLVNTNEQVGTGFPDRDKDIDTQVLKHEFIHHILYMNGAPYRDSESPELFAKCGQGVNINN